jgi:micrococcal nuclease
MFTGREFMSTRKGIQMKRTVLFLLALLLVFPGAGRAADVTPTPLPDDFDYFGALPWELPDDAKKMVVESVHDGDSIRLTEPSDDWWEAYRIIGIQAPEIAGYRELECFGPEAAAFLKALLPEGTVVYIQQDISDKDPNHRYLRHIFIVDDESGDAYLLSEVLVLGGYARARSYPPDDLYDDILAEAQDIADDNDAGLWDACAA